MLTVGSLFSGIGGFDLGLERAGMRVEWQVENNEWCREVLKKHWPKVPRYGDIKILVQEIIRQCEQSGNKQLLSDILSLLGPPTPHGESSMCVSNAAKRDQSPLPYLGEGCDSAHCSADINSCEAHHHQTGQVANGCAESKTLTGKTERGMNEEQPMLGISGSAIGGEKCSHGTAIPVSNARPSRKQRGNSTRTILNHGQAIPKDDSTSQMESLYAYCATDLLTRGVDVITAGVPCQPASLAGKRGGSTDTRWLWPETLAVIRFYKPSWVILENVYGILSIEGGMAFESVCSTLEAFGYEVQPFVIPACAVDAPHQRQRVWILAHAERTGSQGHGGERGLREGEKKVQARWGSRWTSEPSIQRVAYGVPRRVDRLRSLGNAVVPQIVEAFGRMILDAEAVTV